ncbi:MAG: hypothetical protein F6K19_38185 [Cyanothece sp. SIO1E1]|nr:hypothetical protein [Cyanothece sp. SIO1E1]
MNNIFGLLEKISQQPSLYLGSRSVTALHHFLVGYKFARQEMGILPTEMELDFYQEFQPWLQRYFYLQTANSWDKILLFKYVDEETAFSRFCQLLEEFRHRDKSQDIDSLLLDDLDDPLETTEKVA